MAAGGVKGFKPKEIAAVAAVNADLAARLYEIDNDEKRAGKPGYKSSWTEFDEYMQLTKPERDAYDAVEVAPPGQKEKPKPGVLEQAGKAIGDADWIQVSMAGGAAAEAAEALGGRKAGEVVRGITNVISNWKLFG